ncbi:hypothetical protein JTE90_003842 [Oedothorax gibbosus]|uniref:Integrase catalytic domain-containing protein n=1 Tax=Oedothorax gibbosus TaxID=931172 RepID=A0AAV6TLL9_9ARAC|nr:hypothetical protein JTE90_003842 [Oedothorax gibbosus]
MPTKPGEIVHADVCGPMQEKSLGGARYFLCLRDDFSKFRRVFFLQPKGEIAECLKIYLKEARNQGIVLRELLTDCGSEFKNSSVLHVLEAEGITHRVSMPYTPEQNGSAERENRTIVESARSMLHSKDLTVRLWAEAVNTAVHVLNRTGPTSVKDKTPYELWKSKETPPCISHFRVFGTECMVHVPIQKRRKWDKKSNKGFFVGYSGEKDGYRIYMKEKDQVILSRDVMFREELAVPDGEVSKPSGEISSFTLKYQDPSNTSEEEDPLNEAEYDTTNDAAEVDTNQGMVQSVQGRQRRKPEYLKDYVLMAEVPDTHLAAVNSEDAEKWKAAMEEEIASLQENHTWDLVEPTNRKPIKNHDGIVAAESKELLATFLEKLSAEFSVRVEPAHYFLGMQIEQLPDGSVFIHQEKYCKRVLETFSMSNANPVCIPMDRGTIVPEPSAKLDEKVPYRKAVGSLLYLSMVKRPDIAYAVGGSFTVS